MMCPALSHQHNGVGSREATDLAVDLIVMEISVQWERCSVHGNKQEMHVQGHLRDSVIRQSRWEHCLLRALKRSMGEWGTELSPDV